MKKNGFQGTIHSTAPAHWEEAIGNCPWLRGDVLKAASYSDTPFRYVTHSEYACCEYSMRMNLFTFSKARVELPVTVVGMPVSIDKCGYSGSLIRLISDYRRRRGLFLLLNLEAETELPEGFSRAATLSTCIFHNHFSSFEEYLGALRSGYRRRVLKALKKGEPLEIKKIDPKEFSEELHQLYRNVVSRSKYPLETLQKEFFQQFPSEIYVLNYQGRPAGFFSIKGDGDCLHFIFGGMDYRYRDQLDLYYNMLLAILKLGISGGYRRIDFGQTAETAKCRLGCVTEPLYMAAFCRNSLLNSLIQRLLPFLAYREPAGAYDVFKGGGNGSETQKAPSPDE